MEELWRISRHGEATALDCWIYKDQEWRTKGYKLTFLKFK